MRILIAAVALTLSAAAPVRADNFPSRTITLIVPFPPGGSTDVAGRVIADKMGAVLGQTIIVENVGGAGGSLGVGRVARASPTATPSTSASGTPTSAASSTNSITICRPIYADGLMTVNPQLLIARKTFPADDLKSLVAWMKAHPGDAKFVQPECVGADRRAASGKAHRHASAAGAVSRRWPGADRYALRPGRSAVFQAAVTLPQVRAGAIKALVNMSPQRSASIPDLPTSDKEGVPGLYMSGWFGLFAPRGTPPDIVAKLNAAMVQALADPGVRKRFADLGLDVAAREQQTPEGLAAFNKAEIEKWWPIIKSAGIRGESLRNRDKGTKNAQGLFHGALGGRGTAAAKIRSLVFDPSSADGARRFQGGKVLAVLDAADPDVHYAVYQFADMARLDAALKSDAFKGLVADYDKSLAEGRHPHPRHGEPGRGAQRLTGVAGRSEAKSGNGLAALPGLRCTPSGLRAYRQPPPPFT